MKPKLSEAAFEALLAQSGLPFDAAQKREIYGALAVVEAMVERVNKPMPREAEPALIFVPEAAR
jgi:hypothetical protein